MQKRKPLKRHEALIELSKDHHQGLLLCWKIRTGFQKEIEEERIRKYVLYFFNQHLLPHFRLEEALVFPWLPENNPLRKAAEQQHQELYNLAENLAENSGPERAGLKEFETKLEKHIRFEERELFMHLQEVLTENQLQGLKRKVEEKHILKEECWKDLFWVL